MRDLTEATANKATAALTGSASRSMLSQELKTGNTNSKERNSDIGTN